MNQSLIRWHMPGKGNVLENPSPWVGFLHKIPSEELDPELVKLLKDSTPSDKINSFNINPTHVKMDGGRYYVSKKDEANFWRSHV